VKHYKRTSDLGLLITFVAAVTVTSFTRIHAVIYATAMQAVRTT